MYFEIFSSIVPSKTDIRMKWEAAEHVGSTICSTCEASPFLSN